MVNRTEEKQSQEHRKGGIVALVSECFFHFDLYIDDTTGCQQFCEDAETGQRLDPSSREDHIQIIYMISMMAASYNAARNLDLFLSYVTRSENRRRKQHPALRPHRQSTGSFCPLRGSVAETIRQPILGPKSSKNWKTANLKLRLDYVNLRICLRVFTGCLRGFYGFSMGFLHLRIFLRDIYGPKPGFEYPGSFCLKNGPQPLPDRAFGKKEGSCCVVSCTSCKSYFHETPLWWSHKIPPMCIHAGRAVLRAVRTYLLKVRCHMLSHLFVNLPHSVSHLWTW